MARSLLRAEQIRDADVLTEDEHTSEINHYYRDLKDVVTYSGHAGEYVVVNASGTGLTFTSSSSGFVEELTYNSQTIMSTSSSGVSLVEEMYVFYFGAPNVSGTWRLARNGDDMVFDRYNGDSWVEVFRIPSSGLHTIVL